MFGQAMNPVIRADGSPRFATISTVAGAVTNIILDPIFIFVFRWGMAGPAVATVIGQIITAGLAVWYLFTRLLIAEAAVGAAAFAIVEIFPVQMINIFGAANESVYYTEFAVKAFRTYLCMIIFACVNKAAFIFLQAMGKAVASTVLSMVREIVFGVGFAVILPIYFGLDGVLYSMPVSDVLTAFISATIVTATYIELSYGAKQPRKTSNLNNI